MRRVDLVGGLRIALGTPLAIVGMIGPILTAFALGNATVAVGWGLGWTALAVSGAVAHYRRRTRPEATEPEGVAAVMANGAVVPVDVEFVGFDEEGLSVWANLEPVVGFPTHINAERLPPRSKVSLRVDWDDG